MENTPEGNFMKGILFFVIIAILNFVGCSKQVEKQREEIKKLEVRQLSLKEEIIPMKFKVSYENGNAIITVKYLNQSGKEISRKQYTIKGTEVFFDFRVVPVNSSENMFFPYAIYSNQVSFSKGIKLENDYTNNGIPQIYIDAENLDLVKEYFQYAMKSDMTGTIYGNSIHDLNDFNIHFRDGETYKILCHKEKGGIDISID